MNIKFRIILEDGTAFDSHDANWNNVRDHSNLLAPNNTKKWIEYDLITEQNKYVFVSFVTGLININGQVIHAASEDGGVLTHKEDKQNFPVSEQWQILNGLPYFPVVGRRIFKGDRYGVPIDATLYFAGWKRKEGERTIQKLVYIYPNGQIVMT